MQLSKKDAQKLGSHLKSCNLLQPSTHFAWYREQEREYLDFFTADCNICYCSNIDGLLNKLNLEIDPERWFLFMDSSESSFKAVLIHKQSLKFIPVAYTKAKKETRDLIGTVLEKINYSSHQWLVSADFKLIAVFMGLQGGYTQHPCYICLWRSREKNQYAEHYWAQRTEYEIGQNNVNATPLVEREKVLVPPLHIRLGLFKNFIKSLDTDSVAFAHLRAIFPRLSNAKLQAGVLNGPDIRKLTRNTSFASFLSNEQQIAWKAILEVSEQVLGN